MSTHRIDRVLRLRHNARYQAKIFAEGSHPAISSKLTNGRPSSVALRRSARSISFTGSRSHEEPSGSLSGSPAVRVQVRSPVGGGGGSRWVVGGRTGSAPGITMPSRNRHSA